LAFVTLEILPTVVYLSLIQLLFSLRGVDAIQLKTPKRNYERSPKIAIRDLKGRGQFLTRASQRLTRSDLMSDTDDFFGFYVQMRVIPACVSFRSALIVIYERRVTNGNTIGRYEEARTVFSPYFSFAFHRKSIFLLRCKEMDRVTARWYRAIVPR